VLLRAVLLDAGEADFERRGFRRGEPAVRQWLTRIGETFIAGYNAAWLRPDSQLGAELDHVEPRLRGFAFEGAAMGLMLGDVLLPWRRARWVRFAAGAGASHVYLAIVGAGGAYSRTGLLRPRFGALSPLLRWLVYDGLGFHAAYFRLPRTVRHGRRSRRARGPASAVFDQGVGRALWFAECADPEAIGATVARFEAERHADLWAGVGLAATFAGGVDADALRRLRAVARGFELHLAQGSAFAAKARQLAGTETAECELAVRVLCDSTVGAAAAATDRAADALGDLSASCAYARWRAATREQLAALRAAA
jgi:enediyne biosynthesis protein E3